jgi:hypothetical protein
MGVHPIQWHVAAPLWGPFGATVEAAATAPDQFRPALLRFATDDFMDQVIGTLERDPARLGDLLARPETWRSRPAEEAPDLVERVVVPRVAQSAARGRALKRAKSAVPIVPAKVDRREKSQMRSLPLKLYQPAHQRYYLLSASLVCGVAGLPERALAGAEQVNFVLRRLLPATPGSTGDTSLREFAFVKGPQGARWCRIAEGEDARLLAPGEELLPLFPLLYRDELQHARKLWSGLIPVARREEYFGAAIDRTVVPLALGQNQAVQPPAPATPAPSVTARMTQFKMEVAEPWKNLVRAAYAAKASLDAAPPASLSGTPTAAEKHSRRIALNLQWQMQSWLILLDFADYLAAYLPDLSTAIENGTGIQSLSPQQKSLYDWLVTATMSGGLATEMRDPDTNAQLKPPSPSLRDALRDIRVSSVRQGLEGTDKLYHSGNHALGDWPGFHFLLAGLDSAGNVAGAVTAVATLPTPSEPDTEPHPAPPLPPGSLEAEVLDRLTASVVRALDVRPETDAPPVPFALQLRDALTATADDAGWFVARCVYQNPECGPLHPPVLSAPTQQFQLASFFDSDAPARPIRITLPLDTTPAGLRKHAKNTAFVISDVLCGQIQRAKGLGLGDLVRSVLPWPLHKDLSAGDGDGACKNGGGINIGMICSLSIPIITICALILLITIVLLFDVIFRWLPYFVLCFPVPKFKGKSGGGS